LGPTGAPIAGLSEGAGREHVPGGRARFRRAGVAGTRAMQAGFRRSRHRGLRFSAVRDDPRHDRLEFSSFGEDRSPLDHRAARGMGPAKPPYQRPNRVVVHLPTVARPRSKLAVNRRSRLQSQLSPHRTRCAVPARQLRAARRSRFPSRVARDQPHRACEGFLGVRSPGSRGRQAGPSPSDLPVDWRGPRIRLVVAVAGRSGWRSRRVVSCASLSGGAGGRCVANRLDGTVAAYTEGRLVCRYGHWPCPANEDLLNVRNATSHRAPLFLPPGDQPR
jgi:hypothetical protein